MNDQAKTLMLLCADLEEAEQAKVERLDAAISERFTRKGHVVRICQARLEDDQRVLDFCGPTGTVASIRASQFLVASDYEAIELIKPQVN